MHNTTPLSVLLLSFVLRWLALAADSVSVPCCRPNCQRKLSNMLTSCATPGRSFRRADCLQLTQVLNSSHSYRPLRSTVRAACSLRK